MNPELNYLLAFGTGILGAFHCLGMCCGVNGGYFAGCQQRSNISNLLAYHGSRITTYAAFGVVGALAGRLVVQTGVIGKTQGIIMIIAGIIIVLLGVRMLLAQSKKIVVNPEPHQHTLQFIPTRLLQAKKTPYLAGLINGLVPCGLMTSVAIKATATTNPIEAGLLMLAFGAGTLPAMMLLSIIGSQLGIQTNKHIAPLIAIVVIVLGAWTIYEGTIFYDIMRGLSNW